MCFRFKLAVVVVVWRGRLAGVVNKYKLFCCFEWGEEAPNAPFLRLLMIVLIRSLIVRFKTHNASALQNRINCALLLLTLNKEREKEEKVNKFESDGHERLQEESTLSLFILGSAEAQRKCTRVSQVNIDPNHTKDATFLYKFNFSQDSFSNYKDRMKEEDEIRIIWIYSG